MSKEVAKKALKILSTVLTCIIIAITVFMMVFTIFSTLTFDRNDRILFGYRFYIVLTDSQEVHQALPLSIKTHISGAFGVALR